MIIMSADSVAQLKLEKYFAKTNIDFKPAGNC